VLVRFRFRPEPKKGCELGGVFVHSKQTEIKIKNEWRNFSELAHARLASSTSPGGFNDGARRDFVTRSEKEKKIEQQEHDSVRFMYKRTGVTPETVSLFLQCSTNTTTSVRGE
jgi:hypothetical protein